MPLKCEMCGRTHTFSSGCKPPRAKICHKANKMNEKGQASALCFDPPRAINLKVAKYVFAPENDGDVTCKKCLKIMGQTDQAHATDLG